MKLRTEISAAARHFENEDVKRLTSAVKYNEPLRNHTTLRIGGPVRAMYFPKDAESAAQLYEQLYGGGSTPYIIGNGSNILACDEKLDIDVINTTRLRGMVPGGMCITAECGVLLSELAAFAQMNGLAGLEFAHGIPGTLGGAVMMNAGAYGREMKDIVCETAAFGIKRGKYTITGAAHEFSYRDSVFAHNDDIILSSKLTLTTGEKDAIASLMEELAARRRISQPLDKPSAGSMFKRPKDGYAAELIDNAGLKGFAIGGAQVSVKHTGFIINTGNATCSDVLELVCHIQDRVEKHSGIRLELEAKIWK